MASIWLVLIAVGSGALWVIVGFIIGAKWREIHETMHAAFVELSSHLKRTDDDVASIRKELEEPPESQVITTTPRLIETKRRAGKVDDSESAIITPKTPRQLRQQKEESMQEYLERIA